MPGLDLHELGLSLLQQTLTTHTHTPHTHTHPSRIPASQFVFAGVNFLLYMFVAAFAVAAGRALRKRRSLKCNVGTATIFGSGISGLCLAGFVGGIIAARVTDGGWSYFARACMAVGASLGVMALLNLGVLWLDIAEGVRRGTLNSSGLSWKKLLVYATSASFCASTLCLMLFNMFEWVAATGTLVMCPACFIAGCGSVTLTRLIRHDPLAVEVSVGECAFDGDGVSWVGGWGLRHGGVGELFGELFGASDGSSW